MKRRVTASTWTFERDPYDYEVRVLECIVKGVDSAPVIRSRVGVSLKDVYDAIHCLRKQGLIEATRITRGEAEQLGNPKLRTLYTVNEAGERWFEFLKGRHPTLGGPVVEHLSDTQRAILQAIEDKDLQTQPALGVEFPSLSRSTISTAIGVLLSYGLVERHGQRNTRVGNGAYFRYTLSPRGQQRIEIIADVTRARAELTR